MLNKELSCDKRQHVFTRVILQVNYLLLTTITDSVHWTRLRLPSALSSHIKRKLRKFKKKILNLYFDSPDEVQLEEMHGRTFDNCWWQMDFTATITPAASLNQPEETLTALSCPLFCKNCGNFADYWINLMTTCHSFINLSSWILPNCFYWQGQVWFLIDCFLILAVIGNRLGVWFDSFDLFDLFLI